MSLSTHQPLHMAVMAQSIKDLEPRGLFNLSLFNKYRWLYDVVWYGCPLLIFDVWLCSYTTFLLLVSLMSAMVTTLLLWLYLSDSCYKAQMEFIKGQVNKNNTLFGSAIPLARSVKKKLNRHSQIRSNWLGCSGTAKYLSLTWAGDCRNSEGSFISPWTERLLTKKDCLASKLIPSSVTEMCRCPDGQAKYILNKSFMVRQDQLSYLAAVIRGLFGGVKMT